MKTLTGTGVSFQDDPQALGLLLLEILEMTRRNNRDISASEISMAAKNLGYRGSFPAVFDLLLAQGFLSRSKNGRYAITGTNDAAIRRFNLEYEVLFASPCLSESERTLLFESIGINGTGPERMALRVARLLAELNQELSSVSLLRLRNLESISRHEATLAIGLQRLPWLIEMTNKTLIKADDLHEKGISEFASMLDRASALHERTLSLIDLQAKNEELLHQLARDEEILILLEQVRVFLRSFTAVILKAESSGK
jgi:hypothetical protein